MFPSTDKADNILWYGIGDIMDGNLTLNLLDDEIWSFLGTKDTFFFLELL